MKIWGHSQKLTDDFDNKPKGPMWKHGRAWLHIENKCIGLEWHLLKRNGDFSTTIRVGGEENNQLSFHLELPFLFSLFLSFERLLPSQWFKDWRYWGVFGRETGIRFFGGSIWLSVWHNDDSPRFLDIKKDGLSIWHERHGFMFVFNVTDFFIGRPKRSRVILSANLPAFVKLPEGNYPVKVTLERYYWKRPRWPVTKTELIADVDCGEKGIPAHAGKGENSWDLDDDSVFSMSCLASTVEEAAQKVRDSILADRKKYGSPSDLLKEVNIIP